MTVTLPTDVPEGFRARFIEDGWRGIERYYGARTDLMMKWINACGGIDALKAARRAHRQQQAEAARRLVAAERAVKLGRVA